MNNWDQLFALTSLDGRYYSLTKELRNYFSESALIRYRILVEIFYLIDLVEFIKPVKLTKKEKNNLINFATKLSLQDTTAIKKIEKEINHDVKAVEYFIRNNLKNLNLVKLSPWVHWGLTSEDTNNLAYGLMIQKAKNEILIPRQLQLIKLLLQLAQDYAKTIMPARTHGQIAVPTTVGKELIVFVSRAAFFLEKIINFKLGGKLNGAVGNFNAQKLIFPQKNWLNFSKNFIKKLGLEPTLITTQIEPKGRLVFLLDNLRQLNNVWLDLAQDCWFYISLNYFGQRIKEKEVGSSTMPHKINPIDFENSQGNFELANGLLMTLANKFPISRLQRDLSDSTAMRNLGAVFGYCLLATKSLTRGLNKIKPNAVFLEKEINSHPEMLSEGLQLQLKIWGKEKAYEEIKQKVRGKQIPWERLIAGLPLTKEKKEKLKKWRLENYLGLAEKLTKIEISNIKRRFI